MNRDLTVGSPWKVLLVYVLPLFGSALFQQLYTVADTIIAGQFAGQTALTAIGASTAIVSILMAVALGANAGCAVLASRFFGEKNYGKVKTTVYTALIVFGILSCLLLVFGVLTCEASLSALKTPASAMADSVTYLNIYYFGLPFLILYNLGTGIFSALGDSKTPFFFLVFSSVSNIVLDYYMVQSMGVAGVAWATFIAQGVACIFTLLFVFIRMRKLHVDEKTTYFSFGIFKSLFLLSLPVILQNSFISVGNLFIQVRINELADLYGIGITSGFTAAFKILVFCTTCMCAYGTGLTNFTSQNFGAHKFKRIKIGFAASLLYSSVISAVFVLVILLYKEFLIGIFMQEEEDTVVALQSGVQFLTTVVPFFLVVNAKINADSVVRGCNGNVGFMISTFSDLVLRVVLVFWLTSFMGFAGVGWAWSIGWVIGTIIALFFYFTIKCLRKGNIKKYDADGNLRSV